MSPALLFRKSTRSYWSAVIELSSSSVKEANAAVTAVRELRAPTDGKLGLYAKLTDESHCVLLHTVVWLSLPYSSLSHSHPTRRCRLTPRHRQVHVCMYAKLESRRSDRTWKCTVRGQENLSINPTKFLHCTIIWVLSKNFSVENYPLYGIYRHECTIVT